MFLKYLCEFLGTMMLILLGDGVVANAVSYTHLTLPTILRV